MKRVLIILALLLIVTVLPLTAQDAENSRSLSDTYAITLPDDWQISFENLSQMYINTPTGQMPYVQLNLYNPLLFREEAPLPTAAEALKEARGLFQVVLSDDIQTQTVADRDFAYAEISDPPFEHAYFIVFPLPETDFYAKAYLTFISDTPDQTFLQVLDVLATVTVRQPETLTDDDITQSFWYTRTGFLEDYRAERDFERTVVLRVEEVIPEEGRTVTEIPEINPINGFVPIARYSTMSNLIYSGLIRFAPANSDGSERCGFVARGQTNSEGELFSGIEFGVDSSGAAYLIQRTVGGNLREAYREYLGIVLSSTELHLQLVLTDEVLWLYVNGQRIYADTYGISSGYGLTGIQIVSENPDTSCTINDLWLYDTHNVTTFAEYVSCAVRGDGVNTRSGPGTQYDVIDTLTDTVWVSEQAIAPDGTRWWHLINGAWVSETAALEANINECYTLPIVGEDRPQPDEICEIIPRRNDRGFYPNRRTGPGTEFVVVNPMTRTNTAIGYAVDSAGFRWWQMGDTYWVREDFVRTEGNCESVPLVG